MKQVNIHEAKTHLSKLLQDALAGKETIIAKAGKPIAKIVPLEAQAKKRKLGTLSHLYTKEQVDAFVNTEIPSNIMDLMTNPEIG